MTWWRTISRICVSPQRRRAKPAGARQASDAELESRRVAAGIPRWGFELTARLANDTKTVAGTFSPTDNRTQLMCASADLVRQVKSVVRIPLAVKLSPFYSAFANFAAAATNGGADGLVLFNRFYQPDLDLESIEVVPRLELSRPWEMRLPVRWIAILRPQLGRDVSLAATSGAHSGADVVKGLLVGADVVMMTSALLMHGPEHIASVESELRGWMAEHEYESVSELRGSASAATVDDPSEFERANYMATLHSWAATQS